MRCFAKQLAVQLCVVQCQRNMVRKPTEEFLVESAERPFRLIQQLEDSDDIVTFVPDWQSEQRVCCCIRGRSPQWGRKRGSAYASSSLTGWPWSATQPTMPLFTETRISCSSKTEAHERPNLIELAIQEEDSPAISSRLIGSQVEVQS